MNQLVVNGLPDGIEKDVYELIIADILKMDEDEDFELVIDNKSTAIITFAKCYSAEGIYIIKHCSMYIYTYTMFA